MEVNISAMQKQKKGLGKFDEIARIFSGNKNAKAEDGIRSIVELVHELNIPTLASFGLSPDIFPELVEKVKNSSSMKGNPVLLNNDELFLILRKSL